MKAGVNAAISIAGDELHVAAGTQYRKSPDQITEEVGADAVYELISFKRGVGGGVVPGATPSMNMAPVEDATAVVAATGAADTTVTVTSEVDEDNGSLSVVKEAGVLYFKPNSIAIPANSDVSVTIRNVGALQHDFVINEPSVRPGMISSRTSDQVILNLAREPAGSIVRSKAMPTPE